MQRRFFARLLFGTLAASLLFAVIWLNVPVSAQDPSSPIRLRARTFAPAPGIAPALAAGQLSRIPATDNRVHVLVQLRAVPTAAERAALEAAGVQLLAYIPHNAWLASVSNQVNLAAPAYALLRWAGPLEVQDKVDPAVLANGVGAWAIAPDGQVQLTVHFFADVTHTQAQQLLAQVGGKTLTRISQNPPRYVAWFPNDNVVTTLAKEDSVQWVESGPTPLSVREAPSAPEVKPPQNDLARLRTNVNVAQALGFLGQGVVVGVWDGGPVATHPDFTGRLNVRTTGDVDTGGGGHATHVAGTVGGDGRLSESKGGAANQWRGVAISSTILSYSFRGADTPGVEEGHQEAIMTYTLDISQNSWGDTINNANCSRYGDYTTNDQLFDELITSKFGRRIVAAVAIGNDRDENKCGQSTTAPYINYRTVGPPGGAKNIISVGATSSDDDGMADFSDWGPTDDGRIKPDIVAPGTHPTQQIKSTIVGGTVGNYTYDYGPQQGTSMATPHVSGITALTIQRYRMSYSNQSPLPSTVKAVLLHTAVDMVITNSATITYYTPGPDYASGYGRVDALAAVNHISASVSGGATTLTETQLAHGVTDTYTITVPNGMTMLKFTLVWDDPAATPNATGDLRLVNNLDLQLIAPDNTVHLPWVLDKDNPGNAATRGVDSINNVEQVVVDNPAAGAWRVRVLGTQVPQGPQRYSLAGNAPQMTGAGAGTRIWTGAIDSTWATAGNWNVNSVPADTDGMDCLIPSGVMTYPVVAMTSIECGGVLTIASGAQFTTNGLDYSLSGGSYNRVINVFGAWHASGPNDLQGYNNQVNVHAGGLLVFNGANMGAFNVPTTTVNAIFVTGTLHISGTNGTSRVYRGTRLVVNPTGVVQLDMGAELEVPDGGTVTNNGTLRQTKVVTSTTEFLRIISDTVTNQYVGVVITPTASDLLTTTVQIKGNQTCASVTGTVLRCYDITPANPMTATVKFYYRASEANGNTAPNAYHQNGSVWDALSSTRGGSGDELYVEATGVTSYSPFALKDTTPTSLNYVYLPLIVR
jgi:subtilisin family serine protease